MNFIKPIIITLLSFVFVQSAYAQSSKPEEKWSETIYFYTFEGARSFDEVNSLSAEINALKGVSKFKPEFKPESNLAQIIVTVTEKTRTSENDVLFEVTDLKAILEKKGYQNLNLTIEEQPAE